MMARESPASHTNEAKMNHHHEKCDEEGSTPRNDECPTEPSIASTYYSASSDGVGTQPSL
jgi:hypothetical protein